METYNVGVLFDKLFDVEVLFSPTIAKIDVGQLPVVVELNMSEFKKIDLVSGAIDGVNNRYVYAHIPKQVFRNGILQELGGDYTVEYKTVVTTTPLSGDAPAETIESWGSY